MSERSARIDSVRGLACVLLVAYHVIGSTSDSGLRLDQTHPLRHLVDSLAFVRMPLFTALSGMMFALRPPVPEQFRVFTVKKLRRLALPLLTAAIVFAPLLASRVPSVQLYADFLLFSPAHLWFLEALIPILLGFGAWFAFGSPRTDLLVLVSLASALAAHALPWTGFLSISGALYLTPFFAFGILLQRHRDLLARPEVHRIAIVATLMVLVAQQVQMAGVVGTPILQTSLYATLCGCAAVLLIVHLLPRIATLQWIGAASFTIYLWHPLFTAGTRLALGGVGIASPWLVAPPALAAGLLMPVLIERLADRLPGIGWLLSGHGARAARLESKTAPI